jgi:hypothetical protein
VHARAQLVGVVAHERVKHPALQLRGVVLLHDIRARHVVVVGPAVGESVQVQPLARVAEGPSATPSCPGQLRSRDAAP